MPNTKKLDAKGRRHAKRAGRKALRAVSEAMTTKARRAFRKSEQKGIKAFTAEQAKKKAAEAAAG